MKKLVLILITLVLFSCNRKTAPQKSDDETKQVIFDAKAMTF